MISRGFKYKQEVINLRRKGVSLTVIESEFDIPRSTLSGWFKDIKLTENQRTKLMKNSRDGWKKARERAVISKNISKAKRITKAKEEAVSTFKSLPEMSDPVLELALAMLYFGEGSKKHTTSMGASDSLMLSFFLSAVERLYGKDRNTFRFDLHLRDDQKEDELKTYWSHELRISSERIKYIVKDKRTIGKPTRNGYKGVCLITIGDISIQRRLIALYNIYCSEVNRG